MTTSSNPITRASQVSTGNPQADEILAGGFQQNSITIIMGQPGTGKTVFAEQLVFHNANGDRPVLYITTLSEPQAKMLTYVQRFSFYDQDKIGKAVLYEDIGPQLAKGGIKALPPFIHKAIRSVSPKIIVIDSFKALHDLSPSVHDIRSMLYELTEVLTAYQATIFLVGEYSDEDVGRLPEFAIADGIIEFLRKPLSTRDERFVRVLKLRGSTYMEGLHGFRITSDGLEVYPRLVTPEKPESYTLVDQRVNWGVSGMDELFDGGVWRGSTTLLAGPSGSGKTTMGLQFAMEGIRHGEPALYVHFQENPTRLARSVKSLGADMDQLTASGLHFMYIAPVELQIDAVIVALFQFLQKNKIRRLVIDSVSDLVLAASDRQRLHDYLYSMIQHLNVNDVASVLIWETVGDNITTSNTGDIYRFSFMSDNIVLLGLDGKASVKRTLSVVKARGTAHNLGVHELEITANGARIKARENP
jgi:circadian clock protein KaiC